MQIVCQHTHHRQQLLPILWLLLLICLLLYSCFDLRHRCRPGLLRLDITEASVGTWQTWMELPVRQDWQIQCDFHCCSLLHRWYDHRHSDRYMHMTCIPMLKIWCGLPDPADASRLDA
jgi:hypothetical protein